jgi:hypothetical protein
MCKKNDGIPETSEFNFRLRLQHAAWLSAFYRTYGWLSIDQHTGKGRKSLKFLVNWLS